MTRPPVVVQVVAEVIVGVCVASLFGVSKLETSFRSLRIAAEYIRSNVPANATVPLAIFLLLLFAFFFYASCLPKEQ